MSAPNEHERHGDGTHHALSEAEFRDAVQRLDLLIQQVESLPYPQIRETVFDLLQTIDAVHRTALTRLVALLRRQGQSALLQRAAADPIVEMLFVLYELGDPPAAELEQPGHSVTFISMEQIDTRPRAEPAGARFTELGALEDVPPATTRMFEVDGQQILVAHLDGTIYATRNQCPGSMAPLNLGTFSPPVLICPWHNEPFDIRTGERLDGGRGARLTMLPVSIVDGRILVGLGGPPASPLGAR